MTTPGKMEKTKSNQTSLQEQLNNELKENEQLRLQFSTAVKQTRELNEFIQIMLTTSPFGTCIIEEGKVIFANKAFSEAFGMTPGQIRKLSPWEIIYEYLLHLPEHFSSLYYKILFPHQMGGSPGL